MINDDFSCIKTVTKVVNLTLPSMYNTNEISGICDTLESWKRQYVKQLQGIVVGYKNVSLTSKRGYIKVDCPVIHCNVKATFELFYPTIGSIIKGKVNRISQDYISCLVHDTINVTVHRTADTSNDISRFIILDNFILFQITRINFKSKFIHVKGKITEKCITLMKESGLLSDNLCDNNALTNSSPDFSCDINSVVNSTSALTSNYGEETGDLDTDTTSSQTSSHKKKKKHKKSKGSVSMSPSLLSDSFESNINQFELTPSFNKSKNMKRKKSDENLISPSNVFGDETEPKQQKKKIKTENSISKDTNQIELTEFSNTSRKRKRKKSDVNFTSPSTSSCYDTEPIHVTKKMKTEEQITWMNDAVESSEKNSSYLSLDISNSEIGNPDTSNIISENIENSAVKFELSPVKKKKHKKSKSNTDASPSFSDCMPVKTEIDENVCSPLSHTSPQNSLMKSKENFPTSDLFDEHLVQIKNEEKAIKSKKRKKEGVSEKSKHKKKKEGVSNKNKPKKKIDKLKKGSKKNKKNKVISSKKKLHGHSAKLKKRKNKDKKSKDAKKNKSKNKKPKSA